MLSFDGPESQHLPAPHPAPPPQHPPSARRQLSPGERQQEAALAAVLSDGHEGRPGLEELFHLHPGHAAFRVLQAAPRWRAAWARLPGRAHKTKTLEDPVDVDEFRAAGAAAGYGPLARWLTGGIHFDRAMTPSRQEQLAHRFGVPPVLRPSGRQGPSHDMEHPEDGRVWERLGAANWMRENAAVDARHRFAVPPGWWGPSPAFLLSGGRALWHRRTHVGPVPADAGPSRQGSHASRESWDSENGEGKGPAHRAGWSRQGSHGSRESLSSENSAGQGPVHGAGLRKAAGAGRLLA